MGWGLRLCLDALLLRGVASLQCSPLLQEFDVNNSSTANILASAVACTGGTINVSWYGSVLLQRTIEVGSGTTLTILSGDILSDAEVDGQSSVSLFAIGLDASLSLEGITLRNGVAGNATTGYLEGGAVLVNGGSLDVKDCLFVNNTAMLGGGAISADNSTVTVKNSTFRQCHAGGLLESDTMESLGAGGGIKGDGSTCSIVDSLFKDCSAREMGGGVSLSGGSMSINSTNFIRNTVGIDENTEEPVGKGGGLYIENCIGTSDGDVCMISSAGFDSNVAAKDGGALMIEGSESVLMINRCVFSNNNVSALIDDDSQGEGGAASVGSSCALLVADTIFTGNIAGGNGGAIAMGDSSYVEITSSDIFLNKAQKNGGGVELGGKATLLVRSGNFSNNTAKSSGGAFYARADSNVTVLNGTITNNVAEIKGGVIWAQGIVQIMSGIINGNEGVQDAGAVYASDGSLVHIDGGIWKENFSEDGGCLYASGESSILVSGGDFRHNIATNRGGFAFIIKQSEFNVTGGTFSENSAGSGGFMNVEVTKKVSCIGAIVEGNKADIGGALFFRGGGADWECDCMNNTAENGGGAMYIQDGSVSIRNMSLIGNTQRSGAVVYLGDSTLTADQVIFRESGGSRALAVDVNPASTLLAVNTSFEGFEGEEVIVSDGNLTLDACDFSKSAAPVLVTLGVTSISVIRNAALGDLNYKAPIAAGAVPGSAGFVNKDLLVGCMDDWPFEGMGGGETICGSKHWECLGGDFGVYCQCLAGGSVPDGEEVCLGGPGTLSLSVSADSDLVDYPSLVTADLSVSANSSGFTHAMWSMRVLDSEGFKNWDIFPSTGLLKPGESIISRVTGDPSVLALSDGTSLFAVSGLDQGLGSSANKTPEAVVVLKTEFAGCEPGTYRDGEACISCFELPLSTIDGVDCTVQNSTLQTLTLKEGYWRARLDSNFIRECYNEEACLGGSNVSSIEDYCAEGYTGPFCAVCMPGYGQGVSNTCHLCSSKFKAGMFVFLALLGLFALVVITLLVAFLVGGKEAVNEVWEASTTGLRQRVSSIIRYSEYSISLSPSQQGVDDFGTSALPRSARSSPTRRATINSTPPPSSRPVARIKGSSEIVRVNQSTGRVERDGDGGEEKWEQGEAKVSSSGKETSEPQAPSRPPEKGKGKLNRWGKRILSRVPFQKIKIVIVVWQIISQFAEITQVKFPPVLSSFLSVINLINLDVGWLLSASCMAQGISFYEKLIMTTIIPLIILLFLSITYLLARRSGGKWPTSNAKKKSSRRSGGTVGQSVPGASSVESSLVTEAKEPNAAYIDFRGTPGRTLDLSAEKKESDWRLYARHMSVVLIVCYLIYTQVSTVIFQTFACEDLTDVEERYLRADFRIKCDSEEHSRYICFAAIMIFIYPIGIPAAFAFVLWKQKGPINPPSNEEKLTKEEYVEEKQLVKLSKDKNVAPTSFLWESYSPRGYYYEVVECGRRLILTSILVFILPNTSGQVAMGSIFAFLSLIVFEILKPHLDPLDRSLYRTGCMVIFFTNFLALMIQAEVTSPDSRGGQVYSVLLVLVNVLLLLSIWWQTWVTMSAVFSRTHIQQSTIGVDIMGESFMERIGKTNSNVGKGSRARVPPPI